MFNHLKCNLSLFHRDRNYSWSTLACILYTASPNMFFGYFEGRQQGEDQELLWRNESHLRSYQCNENKIMLNHSWNHSICKGFNANIVWHCVTMTPLRQVRPRQTWFTKLALKQGVWIETINTRACGTVLPISVVLPWRSVSTHSL